MKNDQICFKLYIAVICCVLKTGPAFAQGSVTYTYDSAGNRDGRTWNSQRQSRGVESDSLVPLISPIHIDSLSPHPVSYGVVVDINNIPLVLSEGEKHWLNEYYFCNQRAEEQAWWDEFAKNGARVVSIDTTRSVGAIPFQEGISPSGARTYSVPFPTAAGYKLVPNISLGYNSQAAEGWAGYGWDLQGVSCIRLINKNEYYHGEIKAASATASDPVFALDGVPLVPNEHSATSSAYPLETAKGHILVSPEYNNNGKICRFMVLYPNGICAIFGHGGTNSNTLLYYYLSEMEDLDGNRITYTYTQDTSSGLDCLSSIRYGYDISGNYNGELAFTYTNWTDGPIRYYAGVQVQYNKRLSSIESRSNGEVLSTFNFSYEQKGPLYLLSRIDCSSGSSSLPPIEFTYLAVPASQYLKKDSQNISLNQSFFVQGRDNVYKRGKFKTHEYRDGILIYPGLSPYTYSMNGGYGSEFVYNQKIIFVPRLEQSNTVDTDHLTCGPGFQTIDAADIDGDGEDEIVRVNMLGREFEYTKYSITVFGCDDNGVPVQESTFDFLLNGVAGTLYPYPYHRIFRWGDFNGDGRVDLLAVAYDRNYPGTSPQQCYTALIDIETQSVLSDEVLFSGFSISKVNCLIVCDIDNDGKTELCYADNDGFKVFRLQSNGHFSLEATLSGPTASILSSTTRPCFLADLNGDGYLDIARTPAASNLSTWSIYCYNGNSFAMRGVDIAPPSSYTDAFFMDVNRDGMADLVTLKETSDTTATLGTYMNQNGYSFGEFQLSPSNITDAKGIVPVNISAYRQPSAFMKFDGLTVFNYSYSGITGATRHITTLKDSYGKICVNVYSYLPGRATVWKDNTLSVNTSQGYKFYTLPIYLLTIENHYMTTSQAVSYNTMAYEYYGGVVHNRGLGFCGFSRIRTKNMAGPATFAVHDVIDEYYCPEKMGVLTKTVGKKGTESSDPAYYVQTNVWDNHTTTYGKLNPRLTQSAVTDAVTGIQTQTNYSYDSWDYLTESRTSRSISGQNLQYGKHRLSYQHNNTVTKYVLGAVVQESMTENLDYNTLYQWKTKTITTLDTLFRPITKKSFVGKCYCPSANPFYEFSDSTRLVSETKWTYDIHGNILTEKSAPYGATEFIGHTYSYDSYGRYMLTDTDALGRTTTYADYNTFGKPGQVLDYRGRSTYYSYDAWGRVSTVNHPDGSTEQLAFVWGGIGVYYVKKSSNTGNESISHFDALGREVRSDVKRFDGQWQHFDKQFNRYGQVSKESLPFRGASAAYWNTYTYDIYDRPIKILEASGKTTTWSYSGTSVTTVKDGISSVSTKDACGNVILVTDYGGTISYALRDDGQPSSVTMTPSTEGATGITTSFTYDSYGRRTSIVDPSAGIQSESYIWNNDGSHQQTHTGPNGSITTSWDKYGRILSVQRPGMFNTTYTYDNYGLLSTMQSTNGSGTEYTYDGIDRISTVKEYVPDGKWLKETYTYNTSGVLSTIKYSTPDGDITTETYSYANGHNTGITLSNGTVVWSLTSENEFGVPTQITTGSITREYGFSDYGLPTFRKMDGGALQNYSYQISVQNGNLQSRTDVINGKTENFGYDSLNRLRAMHGRTVYLANNGNITSINGVGSMTYGNDSKPYQVTSFGPATSTLVPDRIQEITYNSIDRPSVLEEGDKTAVFTYNSAADRVKMQIVNDSTSVLIRYYIGGQYECDITQSGSKERLYLGGDAYSAPMVLQRTGSGNWTAYNIGRDYLGNITHIATTSGTLVAEYSYDPWGRLRNPQTHSIYAPGSEPDLFLGRGFSGHEHLTWFGLISMNARLYDPLLGRFLSPDPFVQVPDFTQSFNRYSYALNNPLKYTDESGKFVITTAMTVGIALGCFFGSMSGSYIGMRHGASGMDMIRYMIGGCVVGGLAGYAGGVVSSALAPIANSGFLGGALAGGASSSAASFVSGTGFSLMNRDPVSKALLNGAIGSGIGCALGGILGGLFSGISSAVHGGNFWTGEGATYEFSYGRKLLGDETIRVGDEMEYSNDYAQSFSNRNYGPQKYVKRLFADGTIPNNNYHYEGDYVVNNKGEFLFGAATHGGFGEGSDVYLFKAAFTSKEQLYLTMGHEYLHVAFHHSGIFAEFPKLESHAAIYDWSFRQSLAWAYNGVDVLHYASMYNQFKLWLPFNPYSYQDVGFSIIYHLPL